MKRILLVFLLLSPILLLILLGGKKEKTEPGAGPRTSPYLDLVSKSIELVNREYVETLPPSLAFRRSFTGLVKSLDPYSAYLDASETELFLRFSRGMTLRSGLYGMVSQNRFLITMVAENSPASEQGLAPGDQILSINGSGFHQLSYWNVVLQMTSSAPAPLVLRVIRKGETQPVTRNLQTRLVPAVAFHSRLSPTLSCLRLSQWGSGKMAELGDSLMASRKSAHLIVDLRMYDFADWSSFLSVSRSFFPAGTRMVRKSKAGEETVDAGGPDPVSSRVIVMVGEGTIFYNELLALLFQRQGIPLIGRSTPGFISHLEHFPLQDGTSLWLTTAEFYIEGKKAGEKGLTPTYILSEEEMPEILDRATKFLQTNHGQKK